MKEKEWADAEGKLRKKWPERERFERWMERQTQTALERATPPDLDDPEIAMKFLQKQFRRIVTQYGLDKEPKADLLADFLTSPEHEEGKVTPAMVGEKFGLPEDEAKTFLTWIHVGVQFKREHLDNPETKAELRKLQASGR